MFSNGLFLRVIKSWDCMVNGWLFPKQALGFMCLQLKSFENNVEIGEVARNEQFLLFLQCFLPYYITFYCFYQT